MHNLLDDVATQVLADFGLHAPVDAFVLARRIGLRTIAAPIPTAALSETRREVYYSIDAKPQRAHGLVAHECAHFLLRVLDLPNTEPFADYLGAALLVPAGRLRMDLADLGISLPALRPRHPNASASLLATRVAEVIGATAFLWSARGLHWARGPRRLTDSHLELAEASLLRPRLMKNTWLWPLGNGYVVGLVA